ncbi:zinc transporter ZIP13-like [Limulus polyphemus]|uniref:Zinc transporter ZIP13-like n=1 Tax=Limulus polyphemus TaxID=6850 RepID=A0ABM1BJ65_LIMPO|nr:zinc transporter ZIP13-like [Limulus polyphemus]
MCCFKLNEQFLKIAVIFTLHSAILAEIHRARPYRTISQLPHRQEMGDSSNSERRDSHTPLEEGVNYFLNLIWDTEPLNMFGCYQKWVLSILASCIVGLSGIVPLAVIPVEAGASLKDKDGAKTLRKLLSFAVGGLLGDIFLHLLPEAWNNLHKVGPDLHTAHMHLGFLVLLGLFTFIIVEKIFAFSKEVEDTEKKSVKINSTEFITNKESKKITEKEDCVQNNIKEQKNGCSHLIQSSEQKNIDSSPNKSNNIHIAGYLNLLANSIDNFTHGLAVAASFLNSTKMGAVTTFAILIHEIPHEVGDFAILLKSGFNRWEAARAQISTASIGILGAVVALCAESAEAVGDKTAWILPFTAGGFLNIALVTVLPDIMSEDNPWESLKQFMCIGAGISVMALVNVLAE